MRGNPLRQMWHLSATQLTHRYTYTRVCDVVIKLALIKLTSLLSAALLKCRSLSN